MNIKVLPHKIKNLSASPLTATIAEAELLSFGESEDWRDLTEQLKVVIIGDKIHLEAYFDLKSFKDLDDFKNEKFPKGFAIRSQNGGPDCLVNLKTKKRVVSEEKTKKQLEAIGKVLYLFGIRESEIELKKILKELISKNVTLYDFENIDPYNREDNKVDQGENNENEDPFEDLDFYIDEGHAYMKSNEFDFDEYAANEERQAIMDAEEMANYEPNEEFLYFFDSYICSKYAVSTLNDFNKVDLTKIYGLAGCLIEKTIYTYNETGGLIEKQIYDLDREIYRSDSNGQSINMTGTSMSLLYPHYIYKFDNRGNLIEDVTETYVGSFVQSNQYNDSNNVIRSSFMSNDEFFKYDGISNNVCESCIYQQWDIDMFVLQGFSLFKYNSDGKLEEMKEYSIPQSETDGPLHEFSNEGVLIDDKLSVFVAFRYNKAGELFEEAIFYDTTKIAKIERYEYDDSGKRHLKN